MRIGRGAQTGEFAAKNWDPRPADKTHRDG